MGSVPYYYLLLLLIISVPYYLIIYCLTINLFSHIYYFMEEKHSDESFFTNIRRGIKLSYFIASIVPLSILVYFSMIYIYPYLDLTMTKEEITPIAIRITILLTVILSILGLALSSKAINDSISSLQDLYLKLNSLADVRRQSRDTQYLDNLLGSMDVTSNFRDTIHLHAFLNSVAKSAKDLLKAEASSLLLIGEKGDPGFKVVHGESGKTIIESAILPEEGIPAWVMTTGLPAIVNNVLEDPRFNPDFDSQIGLKTRSILCVPIIYENKTIGVLEVLNKIEGPFTTNDEKFLLSLSDQASISIVQNRFHENQRIDALQITETLISALDYHIPEKRGHSRRVAKYANAIGKRIGLSEEELRQLYYASLLHDVGFLNFDFSEYHEMKKLELHPIFGYEMIRNISLLEDVASLILSHHERYDGKGYPHGKVGKDIPLGARIIFLASAFDIITSEHSYKKPLSLEEALKEIEANAGKQFDPQVFEAFKLSLSEINLIGD